MSLFEQNQLICYSSWGGVQCKVRLIGVFQFFSNNMPNRTIYLIGSIEYLFSTIELSMAIHHNRHLAH